MVRKLPGGTQGPHIPLTTLEHSRYICGHAYESRHTSNTGIFIKHKIDIARGSSVVFEFSSKREENLLPHYIFITTLDTLGNNGIDVDHSAISGG